MVGRSLKPLAVLLLGVTAVSWAAIFVRLCHAPALVVAAYRLGLCVLFLAPGYFWVKGAQRNMPGPGVCPWVILSGLFLGCHFVMWIEAVQRIPVAVAVTLSSTHPIFIGILAHILMREILGKGLTIGAGLAMIGTTAMAWSKGGIPEWEWEGYGLALGAALFFSGYVLIGRKMRMSLGLLAYVLPTYITAALSLLGFALVAGLPLSGYDMQTNAMFLLLALVPTAVGHSALCWALRYVPATLVAVSVLGEPIGATLLAGLLFREYPDALKVTGALIILIGIYLAARDTVLSRQTTSNPDYS